MKIGLAARWIVSRQASNHRACPGVPPKWHTIPYDSALLLKKVVHYKGEEGVIRDACVLEM